MGSASSSGGFLEKDNPNHRAMSDKLDVKYGGNPVYEKLARPVMHGTYHTGLSVKHSNYAEWARAKDQFSKLGTGQQRTQYLEEHEALQKREAHASLDKKEAHASLDKK